MPKAKIKVVHIQLLPLLSGVQRVSLSEVSVLAPEVEYSVICKEAGDLTEEFKKLGVSSYYVGSLCRNIAPIRDLKSLVHLYRLLSWLQPDVVHTHSSKTGILGRLAAKLAGVPKVVHTVHGYSFPAAKRLINRIIFTSLEYLAHFWTDHLIVLNETDRQISIRSLKYHPDKISVLPNGVELPPATSEPSTSTSNIHITMVSRLWPQKDPLTFVAAAVKIVQKFSRVTFSLVGDGELKSEVRDYVLHHNCNDSIYLHGWLPDPQKILVDSQIFVLSSLWEGMPLAVLEAMSFGIPCVVTNIPGNNDLIDEGESGLLFEVGDVDGLVQCLEYYILNPDTRLTHGSRARVKVQEEFQLSTRCQKIFNDVYMR